MKILTLINAFSLVSTVFASTSFTIAPDFRTPKNIVFSCLYGGSSHVAWVIEIVNELSLRGHSTFFITRDDHMKFTKNYPSITTRSLGEGNSEKFNELMQVLSSNNPLIGVQKMLDLGTYVFPYEFAKTKELMLADQIDMVICDSVNRPCIEAAAALNIPFVVTSTFPQGKDTSAPYINNQFINLRNPTTEFMSLRDRLISKIINPVWYGFKLRKTIRNQEKMFKASGVNPTLQPHVTYVDRVKLINTAFGFEQGRPLGPLVEFVGPILPKSFPTLTPNIQTFLEKHKRVAYIAFGQHVQASQEDGTMILTGLLEALESKYIDGIIWATRGRYNMIPPSITTKSKKTYKDFMKDNENIIVVDWAPQMAILCHNSTSMFVTHGGAGSLYEASYAGVPVVIFPFFGDQNSASITSEKNGIGLFLNKEKSQENANDIIGRVASDKDGKFQFNINRFKALTQIKVERGIERSADIVEEVIFAQKDGHVAYRWDVKRNMSFIKANNLDLYGVILGFIFCFFYAVWRLSSYLSIRQKLKTL